MSHNTLENYYKTMFAMTQRYDHDGEYLENMMVWEKDIFVTMQLEASRKKGG